MNKLLLYVIALAVFLTATNVMAENLDSVTIKVKKTSLRKDKQFYAPTVTTVVFGDRLETIKFSGNWWLVSHNGTQGWVHESALVGWNAQYRRKVSMFKGKKSEMSTDETALAGKGFDAQIEHEFRKKSPKANFSAVEKMEKIKITDKELDAFVTEGGLAKQ